MTADDQRHTITHEITIDADPDVLAAREAANAVAQFDAVLELIDEAVRSSRPFRLRPSTILHLHRIAMDGVHPMAGTFRNTPVGIEGSCHQPPREYLVANLVEEMCDWIEERWSESAVRLCSYIMWRLNWIHPFADGNGRTARAVAYLVLCARSGFSLPGQKTIPEQIAEDRKPYYNALEALDRDAAQEVLDLSAMETLLTDCLQQQLKSAFDAATGSQEVSTDRRFH